MESAQNSLSRERKRRLVQHGHELLNTIQWNEGFLRLLRSYDVIMQYEYSDLQSTPVMHLSDYTLKYQIPR